MTRTTRGLQADRPGTDLTVVDLERRDLRPDDVAVKVTFCGVCHTDLHAVRAPADAPGAYPVVPGHEFVGEVVAVGTAVTRHAVGDPVAVGNIVDSCGVCAMCRADQQNFCAEYPTLTYGGADRHDGTTTRGGFAGEYVVRETFVHRRPTNLDPAGVAPLLCAGITMWEPLKVWNVGPGTRVGIVGLGGLGHVGVKLAHALGARVTVFTTSPGKEDAARALGADAVVVSTDAAAMAAVGGSLDVVIDTVAVAHDLTPYLGVVAMDGTLVSVGHLGPVTVETLALLLGRKRLSSAGSGGLARTQELLDFCGEHGIVADVEVLPAREVTTALDRLERNDVRFRFVLDLADL